MSYRELQNVDEIKKITDQCHYIEIFVHGALVQSHACATYERGWWCAQPYGELAVWGKTDYLLTMAEDIGELMSCHCDDTVNQMLCCYISKMASKTLEDLYTFATSDTFLLHEILKNKKQQNIRCCPAWAGQKG